MRTITAPSSLSTEELLEFAGVVAIVDELLRVDLDYLQRFEHHPIFRQVDRPEISDVRNGRFQVQQAVAIATRQHLEQAGAIGDQGVDLDTLRGYCDTRIKAGHGRRVRYIF